MKLTGIVVLGLAFFVSVAGAQYKRGDLELSLSGSVGSWSPPSTSTYSSDAKKYACVYLVPGYYVADGFSIEPELGLMAVESSTPAQYLLLNLSYTYAIPESKVGLFLRGGYGLSNSFEYPFGTGVIVPASDKFNVGVLNLGLGAKFMISNSVLVRTEFNYKKHSWTDEYDSPYYSYKNDYTESTTGVIVGFSILL